MKNRWFQKRLFSQCMEMIFILMIVISVFAQDQPEADSTEVVFSASGEITPAVPLDALATIELLDFKNTEIKDIIRSLATKYNLNIFIDDAITQRMTLRLTNIAVHDALEFLVKENQLQWSLEGNIYKIFLPELPRPVPKPLTISYEEKKLTVDLDNEPIDKVVRTIAETSGENIVLNRGVDGRISGFLQNVPFEEGLNTLMSSNGFTVRNRGGIYMIERSQYVESTEGRQTGPSFWVDVQDSLITLDVINADLSRTVRETASQAGVDIFLLSDLKGTVNAQCKNVPFDNVLNYLFKGTNYTFRQENNIYFIGDKNISGMGSIQLIRLNHIKAEGITDILPSSIKQNATIQIVKEHNALMVVGSQDVIREAETYIREIDYPIPQILIEAIVVDYNTSDIGAFGITAGMRDPNDSTTILDTGLLFPSLDILVSSDRLNQSIDYDAPKLGITNLGHLPANFYLGLKALETEGKANIRSRPQIATLNGHPASIKIGTTQYYQLESYQPIVGGNTAFQQTSQRFEKIEAEISLEITPWVSASGEITTIIKPNFSTPHQQFDPKVPPAIDYRKLESTVRLRDGETIVLGGLTRDSNEETVQKLPILGDVPILGRLFQNRTHNNTKAELMIYITPHLDYTDEYILRDGGIIR